MNQIKFTRDIEFNNDGNFFDDHPHESLFYENSYLATNPNLHDEDAPEKIKVTKEVIQYLIFKYNFNPRKIIDIGSGSTLILKNVLDFAQSIGLSNPIGLAVDISSVILKSSRTYKNIFKLRADASSLPLQNQSFNLLLMVDLLEHTVNPSKVLSEALRVANFVIVKTPLELSLYTFLRGGKFRLQELETKYGHIQHFDYAQIKRLVGNNKLIYESYVKIPNRSRPLDLFQDMLIKIRFHSIFRLLFGGFIVFVVTRENN